MAIFGSSFTYNEKSSDDYVVILCATEAVDSIPMGLTREGLKGEITSRRPVANWYNTKYSDVLTFDVTITKPENRAFSREEVRDINAWLTGPRTPTLLFFEDEAFDPINFYGVFTDVNNVYGSGILMLKYTFTSNSPYGWSNEFQYIYNNLEDKKLSVEQGSVTGSGKDLVVAVQNNGYFSIENSTDELNDFVYPLIAINAYPGHKVSIENINNNTKEKVPLTLSDLGFSSENLTNIDNGSLGLYWPRLIPGNNKFDIAGECNVAMTFRCPRKVGAY